MTRSVALTAMALAVTALLLLTSACSREGPSTASSAPGPHQASTPGAYTRSETPAPTRPGSVTSVPLATIVSAARAAIAKGSTTTETAGQASSGTITAFGRFDLSTGSGTVTVGPSATESQSPTVIVNPTACYIANRATNLPVGKQWLSITPADAAVLVRMAPYMLIEAEALNPSMYLAALATATVSAASAGTGTVQIPAVSTGAPATSITAKVYDVTVDLLTASSTATGLLKTVFEEESATSGSEYMAITVWIDGSGLLRQASFSDPENPNLVKATTTLLAFGAPVDAAPPPASTVVNVASLAERGELAGGDSDGDG